MTLRRLAMGRLDDLLVAMTHDPAMNVWLDLETSVVGKPNENYARELLELFSMGAGNGYTQADVVEAARALTGYGLRYDPQADRPVAARLEPALDDYGTKTFLGRRGNFDVDDIVGIVVERPECHRFVAGRFWLRYAGTEPPDGVLDELARGLSSRLRIDDLLRALLTHPRFYAADVRSGLVSQPVEVLCRTLRGFEIPTVDIDHTGVTVTDHGPGLPPGDEDTVFERFRSRPGSPGHGLGLPLARWIARPTAAISPPPAPPPTERRSTFTSPRRAESPAIWRERWGVRRRGRGWGGAEWGDGARAAAELRVLRCRPAAGVDCGADLHLRVHLLRRVRRDEAGERVPELRRRFRAPAHPACQRVATGALARHTTGVDRAAPAVVRRRGDRRAVRAPAGHPAPRTLKVKRSGRA